MMVYSTTAENIPPEILKVDHDFVIADPKATFQKSLNATWPGRAYDLDARRRIVWLADYQGEWPEGVSYGP